LTYLLRQEDGKTSPVAWLTPDCSVERFGEVVLQDRVYPALTTRQLLQFGRGHHFTDPLEKGVIDGERRRVIDGICNTVKGDCAS
jgi:hypothetical protein